MKGKRNNVPSKSSVESKTFYSERSEGKPARERYKSNYRRRESRAGNLDSWRKEQKKEITVIVQKVENLLKEELKTTEVENLQKEGMEIK